MRRLSRVRAGRMELFDALEYICSHEGVWRVTGWEIVQHFLARQK
jgi:hypothetical protein